MDLSERSLAVQNIFLAFLTGILSRDQAEQKLRHLDEDGLATSNSSVTHPQTNQSMAQQSANAAHY